MKYIKRFNESLSIYDEKWESLLPDNLTVIKGYDNEIKSHIFKKGNVMLNSDMVQITYESNPHEWGYPDTLEIDIYFTQNNEITLDIDITYGDEVCSEFSIKPPNKVNVIQYTSYHSKFDPSNTVFAFDDIAFFNLFNFLNKFKDFN